MAMEACLCFVWSHVHALIAETQCFDGRLHVFGCERYMATPQKPKGPTDVSSGEAGLARRQRPGSGYLRRTDGVSKPKPHPLSWTVQIHAT